MNVWVGLAIVIVAVSLAVVAWAYWSEDPSERFASGEGPREEDWRR